MVRMERSKTRFAIAMAMKKIVSISLLAGRFGNELNTLPTRPTKKEPTKNRPYPLPRIPINRKKNEEPKTRAAEKTNTPSFKYPKRLIDLRILTEHNPVHLDETKTNIDEELYANINSIAEEIERILDLELEEITRLDHRTNGTSLAPPPTQTSNEPTLHNNTHTSQNPFCINTFNHDFLLPALKECGNTILDATTEWQSCLSLLDERINKITNQHCEEETNTPLANKIKDSPQ
mmetsp:Transcript_44503/g.93363  ORF Transcript_44503/g.93363 Transcript_44503/m.93363 type:complete len:234 (+) Transcript_44503:258-959(+)